MSFEAALRELGFGLEREVRGARYFAARPHAFLTYWIHALEDGSALFTWEFAIGEYAWTKGLQVGSDEHLNSFLYPRDDTRGPQDAAWVAAQLEHAELVLRSFALMGPAEGD